MSDAAANWLQHAAANPNVLACGCRLADRSVRVKAIAEGIEESRLTLALREMGDAVAALQQNRIPAESLRWTYENGRVLVVVRPQGAFALLLVRSEASDFPDVQQLLADFAMSVS